MALAAPLALGLRKKDYAEAFLAEGHSLITVALDQGTVVGMASAFTYRHPDKPLQLFIN